MGLESGDTRPIPIDSEGVATRGLIVRFYVRPDALDSARDWLEWLAEKAGTDVAISVRLAPPLKGGGSAPTPWPPSERNYDDALDLCARIGFQNVLIPGL